MRLTAYLTLLFALSVIFYIIGYTNLLVFSLAQNNENPIQITNIIQRMADFVLNENNALTTLGLSVLAVGVIVGIIVSGYSAIYIIPMILLLAVVNFAIFPLSFIADATLPEMIKLPLVGFFNLITVLAALSFVRGGA